MKKENKDKYLSIIALLVIISISIIIVLYTTTPEKYCTSECNFPGACDSDGGFFFYFGGFVCLVGSLILIKVLE